MNDRRGGARGRSRGASGGALGALVLVGCAGGGDVVRRPVLAVPEGAAGRAWAVAQLGAGARRLVALLPQGADAAVRSLRMEPGQRVALLDPSGLERAARGTLGGAPREGSPRWVQLRRMQGSSLAGWCARGVRVVEPGSEGFARRALVVDRLLIVGREAQGLWGVWLEGLVLTSDGWRVLPWIAWSQAVEVPRRDHGDVALWDCDLGERPGP